MQQTTQHWMKHTLITALCLVVLTIFSTVVHAETIRLEVNGQLVADVDPKIIKGRSLVPLKTVTTNLGIPISWYASTRTIRIDDREGPIFLQIGKPSAELHGQKMSLDVAPMIENGQTLVPLRFIAEALEAEVYYFPEKKLIRVQQNRLTEVSIQRYPEELRLFFDLTRPDQYKIAKFRNPDRLVIDFPGAKYPDLKEYLALNHDLAKTLRISQFKEEPPMARAVLDLETADVHYTVHILENQHKLILTLHPPGYQPDVVPDQTEDKPPVANDQLLLNKIIVIDPGHGGRNPGALGVTGTFESEINYDIASRVNKLLQDAGAYTIMTRKENQDPDLYERAEIANNNQADIFVSIHSDSHPDPATRGTTIYGHYNASKENWALAWYIHEEILKSTGIESKGLRAADFVVLRENEAMAVLVESAYLTNKEDEALLNDPQIRQKIAEGILKGILRFYKKQQ